MSHSSSAGGGGGGAGDVVGPASATDNAIVRFDGTTGKLIQDSGILIDDNNIITFVGGTVNNRRAVTGSDDIDAVDYYIGVTSGTVTLTLDSTAYVDGQTFIVKDEAGAAGTNNITIDTAGAETIDGNATYTINVDYGAINIMCDGSNFFIF